MTTALIPHEAHLDLLFDAHLLCDVCQERPWTQIAQYCTAHICADCAQGEPMDMPLLTNDEIYDILIDEVGETGTAKIQGNDLMIQREENSSWMRHGTVEDPAGAADVLTDFFSE
jgi:hypothetical protein